MPENIESTNLAYTSQFNTVRKKFLLGTGVLLGAILLVYIGYFFGIQSIKPKIKNQYPQATTQPSLIQSSPTTKPKPMISKSPTPIDETAGFLVYKNDQYGLTFYYPPAYTIKNAADPQICRSLYKTGKQSNCLLSVELLPQNIYSDFIPRAYFYLLGNINAVSFPGQVGEIRFDPEKKVWIWFGMPKIETLPVREYTRSGSEIILGENGGSHSSSDYYIIPWYQKDMVAVFIIPKTYRLRCDLIVNSVKKRECNDFYNKVIRLYNHGEKTPDTWIPSNYLKKLYKEAETMVKSFTFLTTN